MASLLSMFLVLIMLANNVRSQGDITTFQIDTFDPTSDGLTYERDAFVPPYSTSLRLTQTNPMGLPLENSVGRVLYSSPVNFWEPERQASFETTIRFRMATFPNLRPSDGLTFFIVPVNSTTPTGGTNNNLGIFGAVVPNANIFAVEFDIFVNSEDPGFRHIGIDINSTTSANVTSFENAFGSIVTARINYNAPTRKIDVVATYNSETAAVSYTYDLKTLLPQQVQVGLSAAYGPNAAVYFDVFSWYFTSTVMWDGSDVDDHENAYSKPSVM